MRVDWWCGRRASGSLNSEVTVIRSVYSSTRLHALTRGAWGLDHWCEPPMTRCHVLGEGVSTPHDQMPSAEGGVADPPRACATRWGGRGSVTLDVHPPPQNHPPMLSDSELREHKE